MKLEYVVTVTTPEGQWRFRLVRSAEDGETWREKAIQRASAEGVLRSPKEANLRLESLRILEPTAEPAFPQRNDEGGFPMRQSSSREDVWTDSQVAQRNLLDGSNRLRLASHSYSARD